MKIDKNFLAFLILCLTLISCSKNLCTNKNLSDTFNKKNKALIDEDMATLKKIALPNLNYTHSNGWTEDFASFTKSGADKNLFYKNITPDSIHIIVQNKTGLISGLATFDIGYSGKDMVLKLFITETYVCEDNDWRLLSRHACKKP